MKYSIAFLFFLVIFTNCELRKSSKENVAQESPKTPKETVIAYLAATNQFDLKAKKRIHNSEQG